MREMAYIYNKGRVGSYPIPKLQLGIGQVTFQLAWHTVSDYFLL